MDLVIRPLAKEDNKEEIFDILKSNNLTASKYAVNYDIWNFQYNNNPFKKSWNSVLVNKDDNTILGHMGLIPQVIRAFASNLLSASVSNGAISSSVRNKLLPYNNSKTFAIIPLIDCCVKESFNDNVDISFVYSSIHPMIWRTLKYNEIKVEQKTTIHSTIGYLFTEYHTFFLEKNKTGSIRYFAGLYSTILILMHSVINIFGQIRSILKLLKKRKLRVDKVSEFNSEFNVFMDEFYENNPKIITYKRDVDFLNWRFTSNNFKKYIFRLDNKTVGYIILEQNGTNKLENNYKVVDFVVLDKYLSYSSMMLKRLRKTEKLSIIFTHYLSCNYSYKLYNECLNQGYRFSPNPFRLFSFNDKKYFTPSCMYFKLNNLSDLSEEQKISFSSNNWFLSPIFFTPSYHNI